MRSLPSTLLLTAFTMLAGAVLTGACSGDDAESELDGVTEFTVEVVAQQPHDADAFTQGLVLDDGRLIESTGLYGQSDVRITDLATGIVAVHDPVRDDLFAEGLALTDESLIQITWKGGVAFVRDPRTLEITDEWSYEGEGWGLCFDGEDLWMSDGSAQLTRRDATTFEVISSTEVQLPDGTPIDQLNELECFADDVWANVWQTDTIVGIDADSGIIHSRVDASGLLTADQAEDANVLNGIATDSGDTWLLTGKLWPTLFEVRFVEAS